MSFKLSDFIAAPSQELLDKAKKSDLLDIADHYGLSNIKTSMLKHEIKNILIQFFVDEEMFDSSATSQILVTQTDLQLRELEIKRQIEMEKLKFEYEERIRAEKAEREERIRWGLVGDGPFELFSHYNDILVIINDYFLEMGVCYVPLHHSFIRDYLWCVASINNTAIRYNVSHKYMGRGIFSSYASLLSYEFSYS